jgi:phage terminase large subunit-like protein
VSTVETLRDLIASAPGFDLARLNPDRFVATLSDAEIRMLVTKVQAEEQEHKFNRFERLFPEDGPLRRELYTKHMEFFAASKTHREVCFMAANRVGKTVAGAYASTSHLTGRYPQWWPGRRFRRPIREWVAGDTNETTRDVLQLELLGEVGYRSFRKTVDGSGMIPRDAIGEITWKQGVQNLVDTIAISHRDGGESLLSFKSYDQGRRVFQGTVKELIWLDEECPVDVYGECLIRTATTRGLVLTTFTPLLGMSEVVISFLPKEMRPGE